MDFYIDCICAIDTANNLIIRFLCDSLYGGFTSSIIDSIVLHSIRSARYRGGWW